MLTFSCYYHRVYMSIAGNDTTLKGYVFEAYHQVALYLDKSIHVPPFILKCLSCLIGKFKTGDFFPHQSSESSLKKKTMMKKKIKQDGAWLRPSRKWKGRSKVKGNGFKPQPLTVEDQY